MNKNLFVLESSSVVSVTNKYFPLFEKFAIITVFSCGFATSSMYKSFLENCQEFVARGKERFSITRSRERRRKVGKDS